jgi:hypothetical protein
MNSKPRFKIIDIGHYPDLNTPLGTRYKATLSNSTNLPYLSRETVRTFGMLHHLITEKEVIAAEQKSDITDEDFHTLFLFLQNLMHRLIALAQYKDAALSDANESTMIYQLFGNAGLAHIFLFSFKMHGMAHIPVLLATRIRTILEEINVRSFHIAYPEVSSYSYNSFVSSL